MSLPRASTALPYSSTATLTMFATRRAGGSCAPDGGAVRPAARSKKPPSVVRVPIAEKTNRDYGGGNRREIRTWGGRQNPPVPPVLRSSGPPVLRSSGPPVLRSSGPPFDQSRSASTTAAAVV